MAEITKEQLLAMGLTEEEAQAFLGATQEEGGASLPFPVVKINYDIDFGKVGALGVNPKKDENGTPLGFDNIIEPPFKLRILKSYYQFSKFDGATNKISVSSNIFTSLKDAKTAIDLKSGKPIAELKLTDDEIKMQRIILAYFNDVLGVMFIKGKYLYELNQITQVYKNNGHLQYVFTINHKKNKNGSVTYFTPELVKVEQHDIMKTLKEDAKVIKQMDDWAASYDVSSETQQPTQDVDIDLDTDDITF